MFLVSRRFCRISIAMMYLKAIYQSEDAKPRNNEDMAEIDEVISREVDLLYYLLQKPNIMLNARFF